MKWATYHTLWNNGQATWCSEQPCRLEALDIEKSEGGEVQAEPADCRVTQTKTLRWKFLLMLNSVPGLRNSRVNPVSVDLSPPLQKGKIKSAAPISPTLRSHFCPVGHFFGRGVGFTTLPHEGPEALSCFRGRTTDTGEASPLRTRVYPPTPSVKPVPGAEPSPRTKL